MNESPFGRKAAHAGMGRIIAKFQVADKAELSHFRIARGSL
jgi:hypothetical protein